MNKPLAIHIYSHLAKYVSILVVGLSCLGGYFTYTAYLNSILSPLVDITKNMQRISEEIEHTVNFSSKLVNIYYRDIMKNAKNSDRIKDFSDSFSALIEGLTTFEGGGYAINIGADYGEYFYHKDNQLVRESMEAIYAPYHTSYRQRPWFQDVLRTKHFFAYTPQASWVGTSKNLLTYAFPIIINGEVQAVGAFDISLYPFQDMFHKLNSLNLIQHNFEVYYISKPYLGSHSSNQYYLINRPESALTYSGEIVRLDKIFKERKEFPGWRYYDGSFYKNYSFLNDGFNFIICYDLTVIFLISIVWLIVTYFLVVKILQVTKNVLTKKLFFIIAPLTELSNQVQHLAQDKLQSEISVDTGKHIAEINLLINSLETMRRDIQELIQKEKELGKTKAELQLAARIQQKFIQSSYRTILKGSSCGDISIAAEYHAAKTLSGDIYDIVNKDGEVYIIIGDATGKDLTAALFSLFVLAHFKVLCERHYLPNQIMDELNNYLCTMNAENMFISAICIKLEIGKKIYVSNAGHEFPLICIDDHSFMDDDALAFEPDLVLGVIPEYQYQLIEFPLNVARAAYLVTDGISEARNSAGQMYGRNGVIECIKKGRSQGVSYHEMCTLIIKDCTEFEEDGDNRDDKTIICLSSEKLIPSNSEDP